MGRLVGTMWLAAILAAACGPKQPVQPSITPAMRLAAADALLNSGCLECLVDAYKGYDALRGDQLVGANARAGMMRAGVLIAIREHELGLIDSGYLARVHQVLSAAPPVPAMLTSHVELAELLVAGPSGPLRSVTLESQTLALVKLSQNQLRWAEQLRSAIPGDSTAAYLWLTLACGIYATAIPGNAERSPIVGPTLKVPVV